MTGKPTLARKHVNALIPEAVPAVIARAVPADVVSFFKCYGGIWLAGSMTLTQDELVYAPNRFNRALYRNRNVAVIALPLERVADVSDRYGFLTRIVDVRLDDGAVFNFTCFGAERFARTISEAVGQRRRAV